MNSVPILAPRKLATSDQLKLSPPATPAAPMTTVASCAFPANQRGPRCDTLPCRSATGTYSMDRISTLVTGGGAVVRVPVVSITSSHAPLHVPACPGRLRPARAPPALGRAWWVMRRGAGPGADIQFFSAVLPQRGVQPVGLGQLLGQRDVRHEKRRPGRAGEVMHLRGAADDAAERRDDLAAAE